MCGQAGPALGPSGTVPGRTVLKWEDLQGREVIFGEKKKKVKENGGVAK